MADRYIYSFDWAVHNGCLARFRFCSKFRQEQLSLAPVAAAILSVCAVLTFQQTKVSKPAESSSAPRKVTDNNFLAAAVLGGCSRMREE
jgi:hypothetical protein